MAENNFFDINQKSWACRLFKRPKPLIFIKCNKKNGPKESSQYSLVCYKFGVFVISTLIFPIHANFFFLQIYEYSVNCNLSHNARYLLWVRDLWLILTVWITPLFCNDTRALHVNQE